MEKSGVSRSILHVEDEEAFGVIAEVAFEDLHEVVAIHHSLDIEDAYRFLSRLGEYKKATKPDLILLDLNLRLTSGYEVLEFVQGTALLRDIPVIVFSGLDGPDDRRKSLSLGASAHFGKPSSYEDYLFVVRQIIKMIPRKPV
jgi:two-component system, chemotaxis family, response regulator Rcp1